MRTAISVAVLALVLRGDAFAQTPVTVTLTANPEAVGTERVVSLGLPLPPGLLQDSGQVRVLDGAGAEIASHVRSLGPWRSIPPTQYLCSPPAGAQPGIRSVLIQFQRYITSTVPFTVTVWLNQARSQSLPGEIPVRDTWRTASEGTYTAFHGVKEPVIYATLPASWLTCANLVTLAKPTGEVARLAAFDQGVKDFFPAQINTFNPYPATSDLTNYYADYEPWLYDRAQTFFNVYIRTGELGFLREAHRAGQHYMGLLWRAQDCPPHGICRGAFRLKVPSPYSGVDRKYSYGESLATMYWLTGDAEVIPHLVDVTYSGLEEIDRTPNKSLPSNFTERNMAVGLLNAVVEYEVTGSASAAAAVSEVVGILDYVQRNPVAGNPANGCFNYVPEDGDGEYGFSPWMSSLLGHSLLRAHHTFADPRIPPMMAWLAQCVLERGTTIAPTESTWSTRYLGSSWGGTRALNGNDTDREHSIDVGYLLALGSLYSVDTAAAGQMWAMAERFIDGHTERLSYWTRPIGYPGSGRPLYRTSPARKYAWWNKNSWGIGWVAGRQTPGLIAVSVGPASYGGGRSLTGDVVLGAPAPAGGTIVTLTSSKPALLSLPSSVVVETGKTRATFPVTTDTVTLAASVIVVAESQGVERQASVTLEPTALTGLMLSFGSIGGGSTTPENLVTLSAPAPAGGFQVNLSSSLPEVASTPSLLPVPAGALTAFFDIATTLTANPTNVNITAFAGLQSFTSRLTVRPVGLSSLSLLYSKVTWGSTHTATVRLNGPAPADGATVSIGNPSPATLTTPASVVVPAGATSGTFLVTIASAPTEVSAVTLTATYDRQVALAVEIGVPTISALEINPAAFDEGQTTTTHIVYLESPAPVGGATVSVSNTNPGSLAAPASVVVPQGLLSATFPLTGLDVAADSTVVLVATAGAESRGVPVTIRSTGWSGTANLTSVTLSATSTVGGATLAGNRVYLTAPAPSGGLTVTLSSSSGVATVPTSVWIPDGAAFAEFGIATQAVTADTPVVVTASLGSAIRTANLTVRPPPAQITGLTLPLNVIYGSLPVAGCSITLANPAPAGGAVVTLTNSHPHVISTPGSITVPQGQTSATFTVTTNAITGEIPVTITASAGASVRQTTLTVTPHGVTKLTIIASAIGGSTTAGNRVFLKQAAPPGGVAVALTSSSPHAIVPSSLIVPEGTSSLYFTIPTQQVAEPVVVTITARLNGTSASGDITIQPAALKSITLSPVTLIGGAASTANRVTLDAAAMSPGAVVALTSSHAAVSVPASVTVPGGASFITFPISTSAVAADAVVTIMATYRSVTKNATLTVKAPDLSAITLSPASLVGGAVTTANLVTLTGLAPVGGMTVSLSSANSSTASVPESVLVPAGQKIAAFSITVSAVPAVTTVAMTATLDGIAKAKSLTVNPPALYSLTISPTVVTSGTTSNAHKATLTGNAPAEGTIVTLRSSNPTVATVPASVIVPAGTKTITFAIVAGTVTVKTNVSIAASLGSVTKAGTIQVKP